MLEKMLPIIAATIVTGLAIYVTFPDRPGSITSGVFGYIGLALFVIGFFVVVLWGLIKSIWK